MPLKEPPSNPPESIPKKAKSSPKKPKAETDVVSLAAVKARKSPKPSKAPSEHAARKAPTEVFPLPRRWERAIDGLAAKKGAGSSADDLLEILALTIALDAQGGLTKASLRHKDALRRVGSAALLRMGPGLEEEFAGLSLAREGLRRLTLRAEAPRPEVTVSISDADLRVFRRGTADGFRLAEIALRVERSAEARRMLAMLDQLETPVAAQSPSLLGGLRLAAETSGAPIRDPGEGRRVAELTLGDHAVELYRFSDGVLAAYSDPTVSVRLGGVGITRRQGRMGYAEALIGPEGDRVELEVDSERVTLELGIPSNSQFPPRM